MSQPKRKRWWQFSLRKFILFVTLACVYFGCWEITKSWGMKGARKKFNPTCPAPFVIRFDVKPVSNESVWISKGPSYHLWLFGLRFCPTDGCFFYYDNFGKSIDSLDSNK